MAESANDGPGRFFLHLLAALQPGDAAISREIEGVLRAGALPAADILHTTISNDIVELDRPFILVLNDFQMIRDSTILQLGKAGGLLHKSIRIILEWHEKHHYKR